MYTNNPHIQYKFEIFMIIMDTFIIVMHYFDLKLINSKTYELIIQQSFSKMATKSFRRKT